MTGAGKLPLSGFKQAEMPDEMCLKLVYSDFRTVTSSSNQGEYVYRGNSLFDCDFTGVGGQPDGFDQWKLLYGVYRVMAVDVEVQAAGGNGFGLLAVAPATTSGAFSSAEETSGLRKAKSCVFTTTEVAKVHARYHTGEILGKEDVAVLSDPNDSAAISTNPTEQFFVHVSTETSGASDIVYVWVKLTYYVRLEAAISTLDTVAKHKHRFAMLTAGVHSSSQSLLTATSPVTEFNATRAAGVCDTKPLASDARVASMRLGGPRPTVAVERVPLVTRSFPLVQECATLENQISILDAARKLGVDVVEKRAALVARWKEVAASRVALYPDDNLLVNYVNQTIADFDRAV